MTKVDNLLVFFLYFAMYLLFVIKEIPLYGAQYPDVPYYIPDIVVTAVDNFEFL